MPKKVLTGKSLGGVLAGFRQHNIKPVQEIMYNLDNVALSLFVSKVCSQNQLHAKTEKFRLYHSHSS